MKILNKIKKHLNKILIACLTLISSIAIFTSINKTYAYTTDKFSYTIDYSNESFTTIGDYQGILLNYSDNHTFNLIENTNFNNSYLMINFVVINSSNNPIINANNNLQFTIRYGVNSYVASDLLSGITQNQSYILTMITRPFTNNAINGDTLYIEYYYGTNTNYKLLIVNIDLVNKTDIGLKQYYETYYSQIEDNYNKLQNDYDTLQDNYNDLETNYNTLEDNYNDLQEQYKKTEQENLENQLYNQYGDLYNSSLQIDTTINGTTTSHTLSFNDMITNNIISNSYLYYNNAFNYLNIDTSQGFTTTTLNLAKPINTSNLNWVYNDENISGITFDLEYIDTNDETFTASFTTEQASPIQLNTELLLTKQLGNININNLYFDQFILSFNYATNNSVWLSINTNYASNYNNGYNNGYRKAYNEQKQTYEPIINNLQNQIELLNNQITSQRVLINSLQEQIASISDDYNLNNLMWTIASTPFESFKQIWNVNFLGVNISQMVTGIITAFIVLYIVKKFFL